MAFCTKREINGMFQGGAFESGIEGFFSKYRYYNFGKLDLMRSMIRSVTFGIYSVTYAVMAKSFAFLKNRKTFISTNMKYRHHTIRLVFYMD